MIRVRTKSIELMTTEISAWECELQTKTEKSPTDEITDDDNKKKDETATTSNVKAEVLPTATKPSSMSANNTPKKQKLVHFNKS